MSIIVFGVDMHLELLIVLLLNSWKTFTSVAYKKRVQLTFDMSTMRYLELSRCRTKSSVTWSFPKLKNDRYLELFLHPLGSLRYRASTVLYLTENKTPLYCLYSKGAT